MTLLRNKELSKMSKQDRESRLKELEFSLMKGSVTANKTNAKTKEIKKAIARIFTYHRLHGEEVKKQ